MKTHHGKAILRPMNNQSGSAVVFALLILVVVTILGLSASQTSTVEYQIANNDQLQHIAFYNTDAGVWGTSKLISIAVNDSASVPNGVGSDAPGITYLSTAVTAAGKAADFYDQIMDYAPYDNGNKDVDFTLSGVNATVDARRIGEDHGQGGGTHFGEGAEGIGMVNVAVFYTVNSDGTAPRSAVSSIDALYRKMVGVPGGL
jgi:Tfp pilus assembly protein PilX